MVERNPQLFHLVPSIRSVTPFRYLLSSITATLPVAYLHPPSPKYSKLNPPTRAFLIASDEKDTFAEQF